MRPVPMKPIALLFMEASYHRGVRGPRQAPSLTLGVVLIGLAAVSWGTTGSVMTVLGRHAAASPLLVGAARLWVAAPLLLAGTRLAGRWPGTAPGDLARALAARACIAR